MLRALTTASLLMLFGLFGCGGGEDGGSSSVPAKEATAVIQVTDYGTIKFRFFDDEAPGHVENFKKLASEGFYNGTTFHRVIPNFMIQGGDPLSKDDNRINDGTGGPGYTIPAEFHPMPHRRGLVSMARSADPDSAGCQFFIVVFDSKAWPKILDGKYTIFGEVTEGMEVVDAIVAVERDGRDRPKSDVVMESVTIEGG